MNTNPAEDENYRNDIFEPIMQTNIVNFFNYEPIKLPPDVTVFDSYFYNLNLNL